MREDILVEVKDEIIYEKYTEKYKNQVIDLLRFLWKDRSEDMRKMLFEWKYEQNPYFPNTMFIALLNNRVVGFRGYLIVPSILNNKEFYTIRLADGVVDPIARRQGIFRELNRFSLNYLFNDSRFKGVLTLTSNKDSTPVYLKLGWKKLVNKAPLFRISILGVIKRYLFKNLKFNESEINCDGLTYKISESLNFDTTHLDKLASGNIKKNKVCTLKKSDWYSWRFKNPNKNYVYATCWRNEELMGFILLDNSKKYCSIVDYLFIDKSTLKSLLAVTLRELKPAITMQWTVTKNQELLNIFRRNGFCSFDFLVKDKVRPVLIATPQLDQEKYSWSYDGLDLSEEKSWDLNLIDSDAS